MAKASIRDVAKHAGVSIATVSHVLNGTRFVSEETTKKVQASVKELGYHPDAVGRILKTGRKNLIGFVIPDIANDFYACIIEGVEGVIREKGYNLIISNTKETMEREVESLNTLANGMVDGLIVASTMREYGQFAKHVPEGMPVVFVDRAFPGCPCDSVTVSNYEALRQGVKALAVEGHRKIGFVNGVEHLSTTRERVDAYKDALRDLGLPFEEGMIQVADPIKKQSVSQEKYLDWYKGGGGNVLTLNSVMKSTLEYVGRLLQMGCTAILPGNNVLTLAVLYCLEGLQAGGQLDREIGVLGYNDTGWDDVRLHPIHTVSQPAELLGQTAGQRMLERLENPNMPVKETVLSASFTHRLL